MAFQILQKWLALGLMILIALACNSGGEGGDEAADDGEPVLGGGGGTGGGSSSSDDDDDATSDPSGGGSGGSTVFAVLNPSATSDFSNSGTYTLSGSCKSGATISLAGDLVASDVTSPANNLSQSCSSNAFSFALAKTDGSYSIIVKHTLNSTTTRATVSLTFDTAAPGLIVLQSPSSNPALSGDADLEIAGACETDATVTITGDMVAQTTCVDDAFAFTYTASGTGAFGFDLDQTDPAGNTSAALHLDWSYDSSIPATPDITGPTTSATYHQQATTFTLSGTCTPGNSPQHVVYISGDEVGSQNCAVDGTFSFNITEAGDGTFAYTIKQENQVSFAVSAGDSITIEIDNVDPFAPVITFPSAATYEAPGPLTISGTCESGATVHLAGDQIDSGTCTSSGTFSFTFDESADAVYNYDVYQVDRAGNSSLDRTAPDDFDELAWTRSSTKPAPPVITLPEQDPLTNNSDTITIAGTCTTGLVVTLGGEVAAGDVTEPAGSLTQTCSAGGFYFVVTMSADDTYDFTVKVTSDGVDSAVDTTQWIRDTGAPDISIDSNPPVTNLSDLATFTFSTTDGTSFQCQLDAGGWSSCTSPHSYSGLANSSHTFEVRSRDQAGNVTVTPASYTWTQGANKTVALYHFNDETGGNHLLDSSNYGGIYDNTLTTDSATSEAVGYFSEGRLFNGTSDFMSVAHTGSQATVTTTMTVDGWFKLGSVPASNSSHGIISKADAGDFGYELYFSRNGGATKYRLYFVASSDGTNTVAVSSTMVNLDNTQVLFWHHFAVIYNAGTVTFYLDGVPYSSQTVFASGTPLFSSTADLEIGRNDGSTNFFDGTIDELRISQVIRYTSNFSAALPTTEYSGAQID